MLLALLKYDNLVMLLCQSFQTSIYLTLVRHIMSHDQISHWSDNRKQMFSKIQCQDLCVKSLLFTNYRNGRSGWD